MKKINVIIKEPNKAPYEKTIIDDLDTLQAIVGGYIECVYVSNSLLMICNEEGKLIGLDYNFTLSSICDDIMGTVLFCGYDDEGELRDCTATLDEIVDITKGE